MASIVEARLAPQVHNVAILELLIYDSKSREMFTALTSRIRRFLPLPLDILLAVSGRRRNRSSGNENLAPQLCN